MVQGRRLPRRGSSDVALVLAPEGVSLTTTDSASTVRFDELAAMTTRPDGARHLTARDGYVVSVEPTLHPGLTPEQVAQEIDARVPAHLVVPLPARDPSRIPQPVASQTGRSRRGRAAREGRPRTAADRAGEIVRRVTSMVAFGGIGLFVLLMAAVGFSEGVESGLAEDWTLASVFLAVALVLLVAAGWDVRKLVRVLRQHD